MLSQIWRSIKANIFGLLAGFTISRVGMCDYHYKNKKISLFFSFNENELFLGEVTLHLNKIIVKQSEEDMLVYSNIYSMDQFGNRPIFQIAEYFRIYGLQITIKTEEGLLR